MASRIFLLNPRYHADLPLGHSQEKNDLRPEKKIT